MAESAIEKYLVKTIKSIGGMAIKLYAINNIGLPDRLIMLPEGIIFFVELKDKKGKARIIQDKKHEDIKKIGFKVYIINSKDKVNELINTYKQGED